MKKEKKLESSNQLKAKVISEMNIIARIMREAEGKSEKGRKRKERKHQNEMK